MKLAVRIPLMSVMLVMLGMLLSGCGQAPQGIPPITLEHAQQLETTAPKNAVVEYNAVRSEFDGKDKEMAATALIRAAQFASGPRYAQGQVSKETLTSNTAADRQKMDDVQTEGDTAAYAALKQLEQHYADTKVYQTENVPALRNQVEQSIDHAQLQDAQLQDRGWAGAPDRFHSRFQLLVRPRADRLFHQGRDVPAPA